MQVAGFGVDVEQAGDDLYNPSSRTLLTRLTPQDQTGAFFGVYALSGVATAWLAPTMVNFGTVVTGTQQGGFAMLLILLLAGLIGLFFVRGGGRVIENHT